MTTRYTKDHEYIRIEGDTGIVGITDYAQSQLGDVVYVELPAVGKSVAKGGEAAVVESVKAASEVYAPVSGEVTAVNSALEGAPGTVNEDPVERGWFFKLKLTNAAELDGLMSEDAVSRLRAVDQLRARHGARIQGDGALGARRRGLHRPEVQPRPRLGLRRRGRGAGLVLALERAAALLARGRGRSRGGLRRLDLELPHAVLPLLRREGGLRGRLLRGPRLGDHGRRTAEASSSSRR